MIIKHSLLVCIWIAALGQAVQADELQARAFPEFRRIATDHRPNILLIVADDLGYGDVSIFRKGAAWEPVVPTDEKVEDIQTPHLDNLARRGMMMTDFYSNCSVCSPTRAALLTGRYQHRSGVVNVLGQLGMAMDSVTPEGEDAFVGLPLKEMTIASVLNSVGYRTAAFGKWHLGPAESHHPLYQGFEEFSGVMGTSGDGFSLRLRNSGASDYMEGTEFVDYPGGYFTYTITERALSYIQKTKDPRPFFVYLAHTAPHLPLIGPNDEQLALAWDVKGHSPRKDIYQTYKEVVEALDYSIGMIVDELEKSGQLENTLIVFTSDNGPVDYGSPVPYQGRKNSLHEGGIRMPTILHWPDEIAAGRVSSEIAITMDLFPTFASLAGVPTADRTLDGIDFSSHILEGSVLPDRLLYWEKGTGVGMHNFHRRIWAVRQGDWKLLKNSAEKPVQLFNLHSDPQENHDLSADYPVTVKRLNHAFEEWKNEVYADSPYDQQEFIQRLREHGIIEQ